VKLCWLDVRSVADEVKGAILQEATHQRVDPSLPRSCETA